MSTPSSSAAIWASAVLIPCPRSTLPVAMLTVPSRSKCTRCVRRRASESGRCVSTGLFMGGLHHCLDDPVVRATAAEGLVQRFLHLLLARFFIGREQGTSSHRDTAHAVAALRGLLGDERLLHRMQLA